MFLRISASLLLLASVPVAAKAPETREGASAPTAVNPDDKIKCRRIGITGSLVKTEKVCKTVGEWRRLSDRGNDAARDQWQNGLTCSGGPCRGG